MGVDPPPRVVAVGEHDTMTRIEAPGADGAELQAILAAYRELWPNQVATHPPDSTAWRFAGRWWVDSRLPRRRSVG